MTLTRSVTEMLPSSPGPERSWVGLDMLAGGKGYASTPLGQVHYRDIGPKAGGPESSAATMLLLHQSPLSMVEFGAVQNSLARLGVRSVATDTPGYGLSDPPEGVPSIGGLADNVVAVLDHLKLPKVVVAGHHTGACIAAALAARHPDRVSGVVLHGCPVYTAEEAEAFKKQPEWDRSPKQDGGHLSQLFSRPRPRPLTDDQMFARTWMSVAMFLQGPDIGHWAVNRYDMAGDLKTIASPGLIMTEVDDMTHDMDKRAHRLRPDFAFRVLEGSGATGVMTDPDGWAKLALEFLGTLAAAR